MNYFAPAKISLRPKMKRESFPRVEIVLLKLGFDIRLNIRLVCGFAERPVSGPIFRNG